MRTVLQKFGLAVVAGLFFVVTGINAGFAADKESPFSGDVAKILALPEDKIDTGMAALTFAKEIFPNIDVEAYSRRIDDLVDKIKTALHGRQDPDYVIRTINTVIYLQEGYHYDKSPDAPKKPENYFISGILETHRGICANMPMLYLAVAQRLGLPIYPVEAPVHLFLRLKDSSVAMQNIEATEGGGYSSDDD